MDTENVRGHAVGGGETTTIKATSLVYSVYERKVSSHCFEGSKMKRLLFNNTRLKWRSARLARLMYDTPNHELDSTLKSTLDRTDTACGQKHTSAEHGKEAVR